VSIEKLLQHHGSAHQKEFGTLALHTEPIIEQGESTSDGLAIEQLHAHETV